MVRVTGYGMRVAGRKGIGHRAMGMAHSASKKSGEARRPGGYEAGRLCDRVGYAQKALP